ncbi:MAG: hypothetical protein KGQ95_09665 [Acidobacteria bacterium]|nr:hypothetical protein [Acidobacteriota bacterium]
MGWVLAAVVLAFAFLVIWTVKAIVLLGRGIVLLGLALLRGMAGLLR